MLGALIRIVSGISNQIADDQAIKRDLIRMKEGYTGVRITGDEAARDEAVKQFMARYQKPKPPAEGSSTSQPNQATPPPNK
jgi:hypothetical protein